MLYSSILYSLLSNVECGAAMYITLCMCVCVWEQDCGNTTHHKIATMPNLRLKNVNAM